MRDPYLYEDVPVLRNMLGIKNSRVIRRSGGRLRCLSFEGFGNTSASGGLSYRSFFEYASADFSRHL